MNFTEKQQLESAQAEIGKREHLMVVYRDQIRRQAASINRLKRANKRLRELVAQYVPKQQYIPKQTFAR